MAELRRDLNSVRKQLNEARDLEGAAGFNTRTLPSVSDNLSPANGRNGNIEEAEAEEVKEPESLNLNDLGRQMVEKALERNGGNRKKAAQELGISDRTLYRRIKQYGLE